MIRDQRIAIGRFWPSWMATQSTLALALFTGCAPIADSVPEVSFELVATADTSADAVRPFQVERIGEGVIILRTSSGPLPRLLDSRGHPVGAVGRHGSGPGELQGISRAFVWEDSLYLVDSELARLNVFSSSGSFARSIPLGRGWQPLSSQALMLSPDSFIASGAIPTELSFGLPFHLLDSTAMVVRSWGSTDRTFDGADSFGLVHLMVQASDTTFWAARPDSLNFRLWHINGHLLREFSLERSWFAQGEAFLGTVDQYKPPVRIASLTTDECGSLVVVYARPRDDWAPASADPAVGPEGRFPPYGEYSQYIYQQVEVLNPVTGKLQAAATRRDTLISGFLNDGSPFGFWSDPDGRQIATWWKMDTHTHC